MKRGSLLGGALGFLGFAVTTATISGIADKLISRETKSHSFLRGLMKVGGGAAGLAVFGILKNLFQGSAPGGLLRKPK